MDALRDYLGVSLPPGLQPLLQIYALIQPLVTSVLANISSSFATIPSPPPASAGRRSNSGKRVQPGNDLDYGLNSLIRLLLSSWNTTPPSSSSNSRFKMDDATNNLRTTFASWFFSSDATPLRDHGRGPRPQQSTTTYRPSHHHPVEAQDQLIDYQTILVALIAVYMSFKIFNFCRRVVFGWISVLVRSVFWLVVLGLTTLWVWNRGGRVAFYILWSVIEKLLLLTIGTGTGTGVGVGASADAAYRLDVNDGPRRWWWW